MKRGVPRALAGGTRSSGTAGGTRAAPSPPAGPGSQAGRREADMLAEAAAPGCDTAGAGERKMEAAGERGGGGGHLR